MLVMSEMKSVITKYEMDHYWPYFKGFIQYKCTMINLIIHSSKSCNIGVKVTILYVLCYSCTKTFIL